jgi:hypothetical protein
MAHIQALRLTPETSEREGGGLFSPLLLGEEKVIQQRTSYKS